MSPEAIIRAASLASIDLNLREGQLFARMPDAPPGDLVAAIKAHKPAIIEALTVWPHVATLRTVTLERCVPLSPADLTAAERIEAETLADDLEASGGLGHFVCDLMHTWNDLSDRDRLAAAFAWQLAAGAHEEREAA